MGIFLFLFKPAFFYVYVSTKVVLLLLEKPGLFLIFYNEHQRKNYFKIFDNTVEYATI